MFVTHSFIALIYPRARVRMCTTRDAVCLDTTPNIEQLWMASPDPPPVLDGTHPFFDASGGGTVSEQAREESGSEASGLSTSKRENIQQNASRKSFGLPNGVCDSPWDHLSPVTRSEAFEALTQIQKERPHVGHKTYKRGKRRDPRWHRRKLGRR